MTVVADVRPDVEVAVASAPATDLSVRVRRDPQVTFRLLLATVWLLDAVLQMQPFMFTPGASGFSGMLRRLAAGNPGWVAHTITWNASLVQAHPVLLNTLFFLIQFAIAFGLVFRRTCKPALLVSIAWALGVWWFGEGLGGLLLGTATPLGGGPGGVLFYAVLAVLLWPSEHAHPPFAAAQAVGARAARILWSSLWAVLAILTVVGSGRSASALSGLVTAMDSGQPGWLAHVDRYSSSLLLHDGSGIAVAFALLCLLMATAVWLGETVTRAAVVAAIVVFGLVWVCVQNFGGILAGGATDPNSGLLVMLFAAAYWPLVRESRIPRPYIPRGACGCS